MATDWLSFDEFLGLQGDEIRRLEDEAIARAQSAESDARGALGRVEQEARTTGRDFAATQSYTDYARTQTALRQATMRRPTTGREAIAAQAMGLQGPDAGASARLAGAEQDAAGRARAGFEQQQAADAAARRRQDEAARMEARRKERMQAWREYQDANTAARRARTVAQGRAAQSGQYGTVRTPEDARAEAARKRFEAYGGDNEWNQ